jgi:alkanesulfonate monooxygenase SsuD/methylene tetrahydromethanopterin reductase-like flavin-dependent oxidoreductase (luciferase family)
MQIGVYTFVENTPDPATGQTPPATQRLRDLMEEVELADQVGLEVFGIGEHHRPDFLGSAPTIMLAAAAERTKTIRLSTAVTVLSSDDPVRVYEQFSTLDLLSGGRAEIMAGRGSFIESFPLFGYDLNDYDTLFGEKLQLLLHIRDNERVTWQGEHRAPLQDQGIYPRTPNKIPIWVAVGGNRRSAPARLTCRWRSPSLAACRSASRRSSICSARRRATPATTPTSCRSASTPTAMWRRPRKPPPTSSSRAMLRR